jgi:N-formylglutamate amidohydrolase
MDDIHTAMGSVWHVNCHSMPEVSTSVSPEGPGVSRPDFCLGTRDGTTCDAEFADTIRGCLRSMGYQVTIDDPYKGVELVRRYSDPADGRHSVQIEINRRLYMDEARIEKNGGFTELTDAVARMVGVICDYARSRLGIAQSRAAE